MISHENAMKPELINRIFCTLCCLVLLCHVYKSYSAEIDPHKTIVNGFVCPPFYEPAKIISLFTNLRILIFWYMKETIRENIPSQ